jgi:thioredoxin-like negative regulator of GroEL
MSTANITTIASREEHDAVVAASETTPTVIYLCNDVTPACKAFTPKYEALAKNYAQSGITFALMEFNSCTSMMFKFAPNQLPVIPLMYGGRWCRTVTTANMQDLEPLIHELLKQSGGATSTERD